MTEHSTQPHLGPVRFSRLKKMSACAAKYFAQFERERPDNAAMRFGRLVHAVTLGGNFVAYDGKRTGNAWKEFVALHPGKEICLADEHREAREIADAVRSNKHARRMLEGEYEKEIAWMSEGRACGARLDVLGEFFVTDLKTTSSAEPEWFMRNGARMGYHAQLDWYRLGATLATGRPIEQAFIVAVEPEYPYVVTTFTIPGRTLDKARGLWRRWWERLKVCEETNTWHGYAEEPVDFEVNDGEIDFGDES